MMTHAPSTNAAHIPVPGTDNDVVMLERLSWGVSGYLTGGHTAPVTTLAFSPNGRLPWLPASYLPYFLRIRTRIPCFWQGHRACMRRRPSQAGSSTRLPQSCPTHRPVRRHGQRGRQRVRVGAGQERRGGARQGQWQQQRGHRGVRRGVAPSGQPSSGGGCQGAGGLGVCDMLLGEELEGGRGRQWKFWGWHKPGMCT